MKRKGKEKTGGNREMKKGKNTTKEGEGEREKEKIRKKGREGSKGMMEGGRLRWRNKGRRKKLLIKPKFVIRKQSQER